MNKEKKYIDVTKEWLTRERPKINRIIIDNKFLDDSRTSPPIRGKEMACTIQKDSEEYRLAIILRNKFGGIIHMPLRIIDISNTSISTPTPDYIWNGEKWDLKTPSINGKFENTLERFIKKKNAKLQAQNFIIDYSAFTDKKDYEIEKVVLDTLENPQRRWVKNIMIIEGYRLIKIYTKKELLDEQRPNRWFNVITITLYIYYMYLSIIYNIIMHEHELFLLHYFY